MNNAVSDRRRHLPSVTGLGIKKGAGLRPDLIYESISFYEAVKVEVRYWTIAVAAMIAVSRRRILEPRLIV